MSASTSNLGAGFDCLGLALDLWLEATLEPGRGEPEYGGTLAELDPNQDLMVAILSELGQIKGRRLRVTSQIPVGRGLGSSAAATVAALRLAGLTSDDLYREAVVREGHPDNVGPAIYGGLVLAAHKPTRLPLHRSIGVALAVPELIVATRTARERLPLEVPRAIVVQQAQRAAALVHGLVHGDADLVDYGMDDRLAVPVRKDLIPGYDDAVAAGLDSGAWGVTISGAGSTVLAITDVAIADGVAEAMAEALTRAGTLAMPMAPGVVAAHS
ncbi:MAG: homoserine kinase [Gemmatimonadales bacterium]